MLGLAKILVVAVALGLLAPAAGSWRKGEPMPRPRSEVAAAPFHGGIAIIAGFRGFGLLSKGVELYRPATNRWRRLPDLPVALNHAAAASAGSRLYVVGGYGDAPRFFRRSAFVYERGRWRTLRPMPGPRAAAAAVIAARKLYVVGGVTPTGLAEQALVLDLDTERWSKVPGPTPREHLGAATADGLVYAVAGRLGGLGSNLATFEVYSPVERRWTALPPVPEARSGTGLAAAGGLLVSVGGEEPDAAIGSVYGYDRVAGTWRRLADLPTPRHGMGVAALGSRVYAIGGSPIADLGFSTANEYLDVTP